MAKSLRFIALSLLVLTLRVTADDAPSPKRVGVLLMGTTASHAPLAEQLREGLREHGWVEGRNLLLELRYAEGKPERIGELAAQLAGLPVDVIVTAGIPPSLAAMKAAPATPIVAAFVADPVGNGLVTPGGMVAALDGIPTDLSAKQVQLLREIVPGINRLGLISNPGNPASQRIAARIAEAAERDGVRVILAHAAGVAALEGAFAQLRGEGAQAVLLLADATYTPPGQVGQIARGSGLPTLCPEGVHVQAGCLLSYAADGGAMYKQSAAYVDRILKGTRPGELPVGTPARFDLVVHRGVAKAMNLKLPPALLERATLVVD